VRATGCAEIPSNEVGLAILGPLRELDEVAYLRFASVYRSFESIEDFEAEIQALRRPATGDTGVGDDPPASRPTDRRQDRVGAAASPRAEPPRPASYRTGPSRTAPSKPEVARLGAAGLEPQGSERPVQPVR
jgi:hypothetical protein